MLTNRVARARECIRISGAGAVIITDLHNIRYLAGFTGSDGALVLTPDSGCFLTDSRYTSQASEEVRGFTVSEYRSKVDGIASAVRGYGVTRVAFESSSVTYDFYTSLAKALPEIELVALGDSYGLLRSVKDSEEIRLLQETAALASTAFLSILDLVRPGKREIDLSLELEWRMRQAGADAASFDFIVASGVRGAMPHGKASTKEVGAGELVTFDFGALKNGYCSDETVTVSVGEPDSLQLAIYSVVKEAHDRAMEMVKPGRTCREIDAAAREFIASKGYGDFFGHGLGHGVGLEVHEKPVVGLRSETVVEEGMVFTIEPGIYIPGWGGVRIEDTVCVTSDGCYPLTKVGKDLIVL